MKRLQFYLTIILPIAAAFALGILIIILNSNSILHTQAVTRVNAEKARMQSEISNARAELSSLKKEEAEYDKKIGENSALIDEIKHLSDELEQYKNDIERVTASNSELTASLEEKKSYLEGLNGINSYSDGGKYKLKDKTYKCPSDIPAGRYKAEGKGKLHLISISNNAKDSKDLSTTESNTYVFDIASGESVRVEGTIELTEMKEKK